MCRAGTGRYHAYHPGKNGRVLKAPQIDRITVRPALAGVERDTRDVAQRVLQQSKILLVEFLLIDGVDRLRLVVRGTDRAAVDFNSAHLRLRNVRRSISGAGVSGKQSNGDGPRGG